MMMILFWYPTRVETVASELEDSGTGPGACFITGSADRLSENTKYYDNWDSDTHLAYIRSFIKRKIVPLCIYFYLA